MTKAQNYAGSKVLVMADKWYDCRLELIPLRHGPQRERVRALGRYESAGEALASSVEELRKADAEAKKTEAHHG
jgi:hypothetical protein